MSFSKKEPGESFHFAGPRGKKKYTRLIQLVTENRYLRPPPPPRDQLPPPPPPRDPPPLGAELRLGAELPCCMLPDVPDAPDDPRLCTTDGLIRTG
jgi:hypothetical protein